MLIARLIADMADWETRLDAASAALSGEGSQMASATMLAVGAPVLEARFVNGSASGVVAALEKFFAPTDMLIAQNEIVVPSLFISDMDSTMIGQECIDELADYAGLKDRIAAITERAMQGELDFESALRERVALLEGLEDSAITRCLAERIEASPGAKTLTETLRVHGARTVLVTGGFHHFADAVGDQLGFERVVGNRLEVVDGKLTGNLVGEITDSATKAAVLEDEMGKLGSSAHSLATGDGANDIPMIEAATYGFAYCAKPKPRAAANGRLDRGDLTAILSLLGIPKEDWAT